MIRLPQPVLWATILGGLMAILSPWAKGEEKGSASDGSSVEQNSQDVYYELLQLFVDTMDQIDRNYVQEIDRRQLMEAAIRGMLKELDQYSSYIPPQNLERFRTGVENEFGGLGIQISTQGGILEVTSPLVDTPAYRAGIMAGDRITQIEGEPTADITRDEAVRRLKGKVGTEVQVTIFHPYNGQSEDVKLKRETIRVETVMGDHRQKDHRWSFYADQGNGVGYIRITSFGRRTAEELGRVLKQFESDGMRGLILDVRTNPGGLLSTAIKVCDLFISQGRIVSTEGRSTPKRVWDAHASGTFTEFPMVVLVNRYSASASEIVSACLQDHNRAVVVGERTWGKGSVQNIVELEGGRSALKLTTAGYLRPSGKNIHKFNKAKDEDEWGVQPNAGFKVRLTLSAMREIALNQRQRDIIRHTEDETQVPARGADPQLERGLEYLVGELNAPPAPDEAEPETETEQPQAVATAHGGDS